MPIARDEAGNIWETDAAGNPVRMVQPASPTQGRVFTLPQSPKDARKEVIEERREDRADTREERAQTAAEIANRLKEQELRLAQQKEQREGNTAKDIAGWKANLANIDLLKGRVKKLRELYSEHFAGKGLQSIAESYAPTGLAPQYGVFNDTAMQMLADMAKAKGLTSQQFNTPAEQRMFFEPLIPKRGDTDEQIQNKLDYLDSMIETGKRTTEANLGIQHQQADNEVPDPTTGADLKPPPTDGSPPDMPPANGPIQSAASGSLNPFASNGGQRQTYDARTSAQIDAMINAGASKGMVDAVLKRQNLPVASPQEWTAIQSWKKANPGKKYYGTNISHSDDLNLGQRIAGSAPGAFLAHMANTATAGLPGALAGPEGQGALDAMAALHPDASVTGDVVGSITGAGGAEAGLVARAPTALVKYAPRTADILYGGLLGFNTARDGEGGIGALKGAAGGFAGGLIGSKVGQGLSRVAAPKSGYLSPADKSIFGSVKGDFSEITPQLDDAQRLNMPFSLADTDPRLRTLAGAVTRKSVDARNQAERIFEPRALGQADRAIEAIDSHLAPVTDVAARGMEHIQNARLTSNPLYAAANARAAPVDEEVSSLLQTPAGQDALRRARSIAGNEGRDANAMGFDLNDQGEVVLRDMPSFETLDLVKRGFDARLAEARNPVTGQLDLTGNPELAAIEGLRKRYVGRLDELNDVYPKARAAYATEAAKKDALDRGYKATNAALRPRDLNRVVGGLKPDQLPEYQRGYATSLADSAERTRLANNPYSVLFGSPAQQEKVATVFPDGAANFARVNDLEREMGKTRYEVLGGSPTAGRLQADEQLMGGLGTTALDLGSQLATGGGVNLGSILNAGSRMIGDNLKLGIGKKAVKRADEIAPQLFDTDPAAVSAYLDDLLARAAARAARSKAAGQIGSGLGAGVLTPLLVGP